MKLVLIESDYEICRILNAMVSWGRIWRCAYCCKTGSIAPKFDIAVWIKLFDWLLQIFSKPRVIYQGQQIAVGTLQIVLIDHVSLIGVWFGILSFETSNLLKLISQIFVLSWWFRRRRIPFWWRLLIARFKATIFCPIASFTACITVIVISSEWTFRWVFFFWGKRRGSIAGIILWKWELMVFEEAGGRSKSRISYWFISSYLAMPSSRGHLSTCEASCTIISTRSKLFSGWACGNVNV